MTTDKPITICIIKPDMMAANKKEEIIEKIINRGYEIVEERVVQFTPEMAREFYKHKMAEVLKSSCFLLHSLNSEAKTHRPKSLKSIYGERES